MPSRQPRARLTGTALALLVVCGTPLRAQTLAPGADQAALAAVGSAAGGLAMSDVTLFPTQSFRILQSGEPAGSLVSGQATLKPRAADAQPVSACFVSLVKPDQKPTLLTTIGTGNWEAEACNTVASVGMLPASGGAFRAGLIYKTSAPHASPLEPVVVTWSATQPLAIDEGATKRASLAGADSLATLRAALR